jgi:flagellar basal body-associated protein FliL
MADEAKPAEGAEQKSKKKKPPIFLLAVAGIMVVEGAAVFLFVSKNMGGNKAQAAELAGADQAQADATIELPVTAAQYQNASSGKTWDWTIEVFIKVRESKGDYVKGQLEKRKAEINDGIAKIFRQAMHSHLREPGLQTITRLLTAYLNETLGEDPEGHSYFERVLVPKCDGYPSEY